MRKFIVVDRVGDILEIRVKDYSGRHLFKGKCSISNKKAVRQLFDSLRAYGIDILELIHIPVEDEAVWFKNL